MHENHLESKTKSPTSRLGSPCMVNVMELEIPSAMETDENVEKAEAYTKELEDVSKLVLQGVVACLCNIFKGFKRFKNNFPERERDI